MENNFNQFDTTIRGSYTQIYNYQNNNFNQFDTTIRGSYTQIYNYQNNDFSNNFYISALHEIKEEQTEEKKKFQNHIFNIELDNTRLLQHIYFLERICHFVNLKHSNTINFVIANYTQLKHILDRLVIMYNKNLDYINYIKEKIYNIDLSINRIKLNINYKS
jgi:hypothetical protein